MPWVSRALALWLKSTLLAILVLVVTFSFAAIVRPESKSFSVGSVSNWWIEECKFVYAQLI